MKILLQEQLFVQELVTVKHYTGVTFYEPGVKTNIPHKAWHPLIQFVHAYRALLSLFPVKIFLPKEQHHSVMKTKLLSYPFFNC